MINHAQTLTFIGQVLLEPMRSIGTFVLVFFFVLYLIKRVKEWLF